VAIARPLSVNGSFFDLDRAEILKGPQGTLYGRNSTVGAINLISHNPTFDFGGNADVSFGNYALVKTEGALNLPVTDTLAFRTAFQTLKHDGYLSSGANDADSVAARISGLWKPNDAISALLRLNYYRDTGVGVGDVPLKSPTGSFLNPSDPWYVATGAQNNNNTVGKDGRQNLRNITVNGQLDADLGFGTLTFIPAYITTTYNALTYSGGFRQHYGFHDEQDSFELRLASKSGQRLEWLIGALYLRDVQTGPEDLGITPTLFARTNYTDLGLNSASAFGQTTLTIVDGFRVVAGLRYSHEKKTMDGTLSDVALDLTPLPVPEIQINGDETYSNVSYRAGLEYDLTANSLLYANVATGYKAGGFNAGTPPNTYRPEKMTAYTVGSKNRLFNNRLTANLEAWHWIYKDVNEVQFGVANPFPNVQLLTYNAAEIKSDGIEAQIESLLWSGAKLSADLAYNKATFTQFNLPAFVFGPFNIAASNLSGLDAPWAPRYSANIGLQQRIGLGGFGSLLGAVNSQIKSSQRIQPGTGLGSVTGGTTNTEVSLTYIRPDDQWELQAWARNLENSPILYFAGRTPAGLWGHPGPPRTFGMTVRVHF
jgi:iron complex outermembrane receptor protein